MHELSKKTIELGDYEFEAFSEKWIADLPATNKTIKATKTRQNAQPPDKTHFLTAIF